MEPKIFDQCNTLFAEGQKGYLQLPAFRSDDGQVVTCWKLSDEELKQIAETGEIWLHVLTFGKPLQPVLLTTENPFIDGLQ